MWPPARLPARPVPWTLCPSSDRRYPIACPRPREQEGSCVRKPAPACGGGPKLPGRGDCFLGSVAHGGEAAEKYAAHPRPRPGGGLGGGWEAVARPRSGLLPAGAGLIPPLPPLVPAVFGPG